MNLRDGYFRKLVAEDTQIIEKAGITHEQIADSLEKVLECCRSFSGRQYQVNSLLSVSGGIEKAGRSRTEDVRYFLVHGLGNGNRTLKSREDQTLVFDFVPRWIRELHYFGEHINYGIKPEWAVQLHKIVGEHGVASRLKLTKRDD